MENGTIAAVGTYEELKDAGKLGWIQADDTEVVKESFSNEVVDKHEKTSEIAAFASAQLQSTHSVMNLEAPKQKETHRAAANNYETITELADEDLSHSGVKVEMEMIPLPSIHTTTVHEEEETEVAMYQKLEAEVETLQTPKASPQEGAQGITVAEGRAEGEVTRQTYLGYMKHMGGVGTAMFLIAVLVAGQAAVMSSTIWLATWSRMEREEQQGGRPMFIYLMLVFLAVFFAITRSVLSFRLTLKAATRLHAAMLLSVLRARVLFFDSNPVGW